MSTAPVACRLSRDDLEQRKQLLWKLTGRAAEIRELPDGYAVTFAPSTVALVELARMVELERHCCPFLRFAITAEAEEGPLRLELTGPGATKEFLRTLLNVGG